MEHDGLRDRAMAEIDAVYRFASQLCADRDVVDDLVLATFQHAFGGGAAATARPAILAGRGLRTWLLKLMVREMKARLGDPFAPPTELERAIMQAGVAAAGQTPSCFDLSALDWDGASGRLARAVRELPLPYRAVFLLWGAERLGYADIADVLGVSEAVVRSRLYRARLMVTTQLGPLAAEWGLPVGETSPA